MKKFKKTLSLIATISMLATYIVAPITAKADTTLFFDDMEAHSVTETIAGTTGTAKTIVDGYYDTSATLGGDTLNGYKLDYDKRYGNGYEGGNVATTNKTLTLTPHAGAFSAAANLTYDVGTAKNYTFSVDVRNSYMWSQTPVSGIRMYDPEDEANYYELALITPQEPGDYVYSEYEGALQGSLPPRFTKVKGANDSTAKTVKDSDIPDQWKATAYSPENAVTMLHKVKGLTNPSDYELRTTWFTLSLTKIGNTICWKVFDKERNKIVWEASFEDDSPLFEGMAKLQLFVYGNGANNDVFFDNVSINSVDNSFKIPPKAALVNKSEPEPTPDPEPDTPDVPVVSYDVTPDTPLYLLKDTIEGHQLYTPVGTKAEDITNNVPSHATGHNEVTSDIMVDGYWATSTALGGYDWYNDYCVQYDEMTGNGWSGETTSPIGQIGSTPDKSNKVIALKPHHHEKGQLCVLNLTKNLGNADNFIYSVDVRNFFCGTVNPVAGIRVADPTDDTSYYELALISKTGSIYEVSHDGAKLEKPRFTKVKGGTTHTPAPATSTPSQWKYVDYGSVGTASGMYKDNGYKTGWFTLTIAKKGNTIYWSILDKAYNEIVWEDSFTDDSPLFNGLGRLQLFAYGGGKSNTPTLFDNIDAKILGAKLFNYEDVADKFTDDFTSAQIDSIPSGYSADNAIRIGYDKATANYWGGASDTDITDSKVLWLEGAGKVDYSNIANNYSVDLRNYFYGETNPVTGIRIVDINNDKNYYELAILSGKDAYTSFADAKLYPPRFTKVKGATATTPAISQSIPAEVLYQESGSEKIAGGLCAELTAGIGYSTYWFTLELGKVGNDITFKVIDRESKSVVWSKVWTDESPLFEDAGKLQIFTYGANSKILIDNVSGVAMGDSGLRIEASWVKDSIGAPMMMTADYDPSGRLISVTDIDAPAGIKGYYLSPESITIEGTSKKLFIWDEVTKKPATATAQYQEGDIDECIVTYPTFSTKAFTVSLDDGNPAYDPAIMSLMKKYGIKGTFNLTGSNSTVYADYVDDNFEVANHTTHIEMFNESKSYQDCLDSINNAYNIIKEKTGGIEAKGLVWPYRAPKARDFWRDLYAYVGERYEYAREAGESYEFTAPMDWLQWNATAWSDNWRTYTDKYMQLGSTKALTFLALAGHAFDTPKGETSMASLAEYVFSTVAADKTIWKATNLELCKYIKASKALVISSKNVYNPSKDVTVYMLIDGVQYVAQPESYAVPVVFEDESKSRFEVIYLPDSLTTPTIEDVNFVEDLYIDTDSSDTIIGNGEFINPDTNAVLDYTASDSKNYNKSSNIWQLQ